MSRTLVPRPCHEDWDKLTPEQRGHHCTVCETKVWDLSSLTEAQAKAFLRARAGEDLCVSYHERPDGTVIHRPTPVVPLQRLMRRLPAAAGLSLALAGCAPNGDATGGEPKAQTEPTASADGGTPAPTPSAAETGEALPEPAPTTAHPEEVDPTLVPEPPPDPDTKPDPDVRHIKGKWATPEDERKDTAPKPDEHEKKKGKVTRVPVDEEPSDPPSP